MDEYTADAFANRDEPLPLITVSQSDLDTSSSEGESASRKHRIKNSLSPSSLKNIGQDFAAAQLEKNAPLPGVKQSLQDRVFSR